MNDPNIEETSVSSFDGVALHVYHSHRTAEAEVLLIVLPIGVNAALVKPALSQLSRNYNVITWEGRLVLDPQATMPNQQALSIDANVRDAFAILDRFGVAAALMIGYCSGAATALHIAAADPKRIKKIALVNGAYFLRGADCTLTQYEKDIFDLAPRIAAGHAEAQAVFALLQAMGARKAADPDQLTSIYTSFTDVECLYRFGVGLCHLIDCDVRSVARRIDAPTLLTAGKRDEQTHYSSSVLMETQIRAGALLIDEDGDHYEFCRAKPNLLNPIVDWFSAQ